MINFIISVSVNEAREAENVIRYFGDLNDCLYRNSSNSLECTWGSDLDNSIWNNGLDDDEIRESFRSTVREAFDMAGVCEYNISEI